MTFLSLLFLSLSADATTTRFIAMGDMPYEMPADESRFEKMTAEANRLKPDFAIHVGDIKASHTKCSDKKLKDAFNRFSKFLVPLIYTPGDNEWTDCGREKAGEYDPIERLAFLRNLFFADEFSLGQAKLKLLRQSQFAENARWARGDIGFATIHVVGSNNGDVQLISEYKKRNEANLAWLSELFKLAQDQNQNAVVIIMHADPLFTEPESARTGFKDITEAFVKHAREYNKPILLIHGDTHTFRFGKVLGLNNFTRLEVPGAPTAQSVEVVVDSSSVEPFSVKLLNSF